MQGGHIRGCAGTAFFGMLACGAAAFAGAPVPPSPSEPWSPPGLEKYEGELARYQAGPAAVQIDPQKIYDLPELIDIAERNNPETRTAWQRARQAAAAVGLSASAYYPFLAASAGAGYSRAFLPFPSLVVDQRTLVQQTARAVSSAGGNTQAALQILETKNLNLAAPPVSVTGGGTLILDSEASDAMLSVKWLVIDFGQRAALVDAAKQQLMMADVGFNATHQRIVFEVTRNFYALGEAREQVAVARSALRAAQTVEQAVKARLDNGLAIKPEFLQARQQSAQFAFQLEAALGAESDAQAALVESLGVLPAAQLQVVDFTNQPLPAPPAKSVDALIDLALAQRPDLVIKLADLHAMQAEVRAAQADFYPKIAVAANAGYASLRTSVDDSAYFGGDHTVYGGEVTVDVPVFDGGERLEKLRAAQAGLRAAESELAQARDTAVREVWKAYTDFETALHEEDAAEKLLASAQDAGDAVLASYRNGLSTYVELVNAERDVAAARSAGADTRAAIFTSAAALALSIGDLAKPAPARNNR